MGISTRWPGRPERSGRTSKRLISLVGALGAAFVLADDPDSRLGERYEKRDERAAHGNSSGIRKAALKKARAILLSEWAIKANARRWGRTTPKERAAIVAKLNAARAAKRCRARTKKAA